MLPSFLLALGVHFSSFLCSFFHISFVEPFTYYIFTATYYIICMSLGWTLHYTFHFVLFLCVLE